MSYCHILNLIISEILSNCYYCTIGSKKRHRSDENGGNEAEFLGFGLELPTDNGEAFTSTLSERVKRRKRIITYKDDSDEENDATSERVNNMFETPVKKSKKYDDSWEPEVRVKKVSKHMSGDVEEVEADDPVLAGQFIYFSTCTPSKPLHLNTKCA